MVRRRGGWTVMAVALLMAGCGARNPLPTMPAWESLPAGSPLRSHTLRPEDAWLRHYLMFGEREKAVAAFERGSPLAPSDRLLRALQQAVMFHEMGEYARSNELLAWAEVEAELRYTRSLTREAASLLINDRVLAYTPPAGELAMIPYYGMLNHLALRNLDGAAVEARKAVALLERLDHEPVEECNRNGMIQYVAGLVQEAAGDTNDAVVSLRQAERSLRECEGSPGRPAATVAEDLYRLARATGLVEVADSVAERYSLDTDARDPGSAGLGELLVIVEQGFVAHRTQDALHIPIPDDDLEHLDDEDGAARLAARISRELLLGQDPRWRHHRWRYGRSAWADALDGAYILRLAWPTYRLEANRPREVRVGVNEVLAQPVPFGNLSVVMREELADERPEMLTRLLLRGLTKYLITREVEEKVEEKHGETAGFILGRIANIAGNQLEQADTRSWSLLPDRISLLRLRLPAGTHEIRLETIGESGESRVRSLGTITLQPGGLLVLCERVFSRDGEAQWNDEFDPVGGWLRQEVEGDSIPGSLTADTLSAGGDENAPGT